MINVAELWRVIVLGIVEGITEFLPISSTGHLILMSDLLDFTGSMGGTFEIFIQLGAVLAVVWYYRRDLWQQVKSVPQSRAVQRFWLNLAIAFVPAAGIGFLIHDWIKERLFNPVTVAAALIVGGLALLWVERRPHAGRTTSLYDISPRQALTVGIAQVLALIPGASRSGMSIIGGLFAGLDRSTATAFSFYLAIPVLGMATIYDLLSNLDQISRSDIVNLALGTVVSFVVALLAIGWLLRYVARNSFNLFGIYRIVLGLVVLAWFWLR